MATIKTVDIGSAPNDPAADPLRTSFDKLNDNDEALNTELADKAEADNTLRRDGNNSPSANISWGSNKITNLADGTADADAANKGQVDAVADAALDRDGGNIWGGTSGGTANAQTLSLSPSITAYSAGMKVRFLAGNTITGAATLNIDSVGAVALLTRGGGALESGEIVSGELIEAVYDGTGFRIQKTLERVVLFTSSGTWNKDTGLVVAEIELVGGGGGGGGTEATAGGESAQSSGGGGGGYSREKIDAASLGATETVTVGAGGAGGAAGLNTGTAGGTTSFGALLSATGGAGGSEGASGTTTISGAGTAGSGSGGDVNSDGFPGGAGFVADAVRSLSGVGGGSFFGGGPKSGNNDSGVSNAVSPGAGGGGHGSSASRAATAGGDGADGLVIVREFY